MRMQRYLSFIICHLSFSVALLLMAGCSEEVTSFFPDDGEIQSGDPVMFTTYVPGTATRATAAETVFNTKMSSYKAVAEDYEFNVEMYEEFVDDALGNSDYVPTKTVTSAGEPPVETTTYASDGTLKVKTGTEPLYWPSNNKNYGFKVTAGTTTLGTDQTTAENLLQQDQLLGYGFEPLWNTDGNSPVDNENGLNYRTAKEWKAANVSLGMASAEDYKKIPLYLQHQRSLITIILKAGEGVNREDLAYQKAIHNIQTTIYSYGATNKAIQPFAEQAKVNYESSDFGGEASGVETTKYTAVVEHHDYLAGATSEVIAEIHLSGQRFTFYASNDFLYAAYLDNAHANHATAVTHMNGYNLLAGKHLIITATLGRGSRKILITAYVEDWTEAVTSSIVDDYGQAGDPIQINTRQELYDFLLSDKNKAGNVAIIVPNSLNLEKNGTDVDAPWVAPSGKSFDLNCTLNMAGATFRTDHQVFSTIGSSGNLVNGTITVGNTTVATALAETNLGTIERVTVAPKDALGNKSTGKASRAGLVINNSGTIAECTSTLPIQGNETSGTVYVGGIAARSVYSSDNGNTMPVIDGCTVDARVDGGEGNRGGGIVGEAVGRVTNNTFDYGITILQDATNFKNIIQAKADQAYQLRAYNNAWPTNALNDVANTNRTLEENRYDGVLDCQKELAALLTETYNQNNKVYRLSNDFSVTKTTVGDVTGWPIVAPNDILNQSGGNNVFFKLDGYNKTISTDAMLFNNIQNDIYDLTIQLSDNMIATKSDGTHPGGQDVMAPLAYSVYNATLRNIKVKGGAYRIQAATVGGIVVWAYNGAIIENCQCKASLQVWLYDNVGVDAKIYSGGIAACAAHATFTQCVFHIPNAGETLFRNIAGASGQEGTFNDTSVKEDSPSFGIFYGGIVGGTVPKGTGGTTEYPSLLITDCTSWFSTSGTVQKGAIVGYAEYSDVNSNLANGIADGCQGNWWNSGSNGIGTYISGKTIEQLLGKPNAVQPAQDLTF